MAKRSTAMHLIGRHRFRVTTACPAFTIPNSAFPDDNRPHRPRDVIYAPSAGVKSPQRCLPETAGYHPFFMASSASIIVPTYREAANLEPLTRRVFTALEQAGITGELIIVDDHSNDGTEEIATTLTHEYPLRLIVRRDEKGLSSAVLAGFAQARYDRFVVMDADLQHPPETIPELLRRLDEGECDFVLGTRYVPGGRIAEDWSWPRRLASRVATALARPLAPLSDPMSGFFALRRETWERADRLNPVGYKIGLELYVKGRCRHPAEVPIDFALRAAGESKFGFRQQWEYARHLWRLYRYKYPVWFWGMLLVIVVILGLGVLAISTF